MTDPCTISLNPDGALLLHIPGTGAGHHVVIPNNEAGHGLLHDILQARQTGHECGRIEGIGTPAAPTQHMVKEWLRKNKPKRAVPPSPLPDLDLDGILQEYIEGTGEEVEAIVSPRS